MVPDASSASSAPAAPVSGQDVLNSLTSEQRATWERTGEIPETSETPAAESSPAEPAAQAASTDAQTKPASEPAKPKGAKARAVALDSEITDLREKLRIRAALRDELARTSPQPDVKPAASSPAPVTVSDGKRYAAMPDAPKVADFDSYDEYTAQLAVFIADQRHAEREQAHARDQQEQSRRETLQKRLQAHDAQAVTFAERLTQAQASDPAVLDAIDPQLLELRPSIMLHLDPQPGERYTFGHAVADVLLQSEQPVALMRHLSDKKEAHRLSQLSPDAFYREIGRIEARLGTASVAPPPKTVTSAPAPPPTVGSKPAETGDAAAQALARGDFAAYEKAANRRDLAAAR